MKQPSGAISAGIIGAGLMGEWHARNLTLAGGRIAAVTDRDIDAAQQLAGRYQSAQSFTDLDTMLERAPLQVLHICTPTGTHYAFIETAVACGLNVMVEKPMTETYAEAQRLYESAAGQDVLLCPIHQFVFQDGVINARNALSRTGSIIHLKSIVRSAGGIGRSDAEKDQIAADILPHCLSLIQLFIGG